MEFVNSAEPSVRTLVRIPVIAAFAQHSALRVLATRAVVLVAFVRLVVIATNVESPVGVVLLVAALGYIDVRRRHEMLFWANLGYSTWQTTGLFAAVGFAGEALIAIAGRPAVAAALQIFR